MKQNIALIVLSIVVTILVADRFALAQESQYSYTPLPTPTPFVHHPWGSVVIQERDTDPPVRVVYIPFTTYETSGYQRYCFDAATEQPIDSRYCPDPPQQLTWIDRAAIQWAREQMEQQP